MNVMKSVEIAAPRARVWAALVDVERWSEWTSSVTNIDVLDKPLAIGSTAKVVQPRLRPAVYTVTDCTVGAEFTWRTQLPGLSIIASHTIEGPEAGPVTVTLGITQSGLLSPIISLLYGKLTREYVGMEAEGLKRICEPN